MVLSNVTQERESRHSAYTSVITSLQTQDRRGSQQQSRDSRAQPPFIIWAFQEDQANTMHQQVLLETLSQAIVQYGHTK